MADSILHKEVKQPIEMPMKKWFRSMQSTPLYTVLTMTTVVFVIGLVMSHITHSLTLLLVSYQLLCNIIALIGCITTIKHAKRKSIREEVRDELLQGKNSSSSNISTISNSECINDQQFAECSDKKTKAKDSKTRVTQENKLKNTFGWTRIDVISMLICCIFLASLCFSVLVEAVQTLVHIDHQDEMHRPIMVLFLAIAILILNFICYLLIGGYTFHQGSFLYVNESGNVILDSVITSDRAVAKGERRLSRTRAVRIPHTKQRQSFKEMARDTTACIFLIITSLAVYFVRDEVGKYIDPAVSILSCIVLLVLSYPYMKESCLILLQTIPDTMDIEEIQKQLMDCFPDILNVHDFHVWQLTTHRVISTIHIIFQNPRVYAKIADRIKEFFTDQGITELTVQPEFTVKSLSRENLINQKPCLVKCLSEGCITSHCCPDIPDKENIKTSRSNRSIDYHKEVGAFETVIIEDCESKNVHSVTNSIGNIEVEATEKHLSKAITIEIGRLPQEERIKCSSDTNHAEDKQDNLIASEDTHKNIKNQLPHLISLPENCDSSDNQKNIMKNSVQEVTAATEIDS